MIRPTDARSADGAPQAQILEDGALLLTWVDSHQTALAASLLRAECPCAGCRDRPAGAAPPPARIVRFETVGRYALQLWWSDGHSTGIYPYRFLRAACSCLHCRGT